MPNPKFLFLVLKKIFNMNEELENLVKIRRLKKEPASRVEFEGMSAPHEDFFGMPATRTWKRRADLIWPMVPATDSRSLLRRQGYRSENRYTVFQSLVHTVGTDRVDVQIFSRAHNARNLAEYEGRSEIDKQFLVELIRCATTLEKAVAKLDPPPEE